MLPDVHVICLDSVFETRGKLTLAFIQANLSKSFYNTLIASKAVTPSDFVLEGVVDVSQLSIISGKTPRVTHADLQNSRQVACALSHINVWHTCIETQRPVLVFEDDVRPKRLSVRLEQARMLVDADLVLLACTYSSKNSTTKQVYNFGGAGCYYLTPQGATTLLKGALPISMHIDHYMSTCIDAYGLRVFGIENNIDQTETESGSTLGHSRNMTTIVVPRLEILVTTLSIVLFVLILVGCTEIGVVITLFQQKHRNSRLQKPLS